MKKAIHSRKTRRRLVLLLSFTLGITTLLVIALSLKTGSPEMTWGELYEVLFAGRGEELQRVVVWEMRVPRIILGILVGAMLGAAGTLMQGSMNNSLAGPELLGVSAGASLTIAVIAVFHLPLTFQLQPVFGLAGGLLGGLAVLLAARGAGIRSLLLIGISVTAILNGLLIFLIAMGTSNDTQMLFTYLLGTLANRTWVHVMRILPWALVSLPAAFWFIRSLNLFAMGDEAAAGLGLQVNRVRLQIFIVCTALVASTVAQCGPIGYISLLAPHFSRLMLRTSDARLVLPAATVLGGILLIAADGMARWLFHPEEIPVGVWTTVLGGCVFLLVYLKGSGSGRYANS